MFKNDYQITEAFVGFRCVPVCLQWVPGMAVAGLERGLFGPALFTQSHLGFPLFPMDQWLFLIGPWRVENLTGRCGRPQKLKRCAFFMFELH